MEAPMPKERRRPKILTSAVVRRSVGVGWIALRSVGYG